MEVAAGFARNGRGGSLVARTGFGEATSSGIIDISTANGGESGVSGSIDFSTGTSSAGNSGYVNIETGEATGGRAGPTSVLLTVLSRCLLTLDVQATFIVSLGPAILAPVATLFWFLVRPMTPRREA